MVYRLLYMVIQLYLNRATMKMVIIQLLLHMVIQLYLSLVKKEDGYSTTHVIHGNPVVAPEPGRNEGGYSTTHVQVNEPRS